MEAHWVIILHQCKALNTSITLVKSNTDFSWAGSQNHVRTVLYSLSCQITDLKKTNYRSKLSSLTPRHRILRKQTLTEGHLLTIYLPSTLQTLLSKNKAFPCRRWDFIDVSPQDNLSHKQPSQGSSGALETSHYPAYSTRYQGTWTESHTVISHCLHIFPTDENTAQHVTVWCLSYCTVHSWKLLRCFSSATTHTEEKYHREGPGRMTVSYSWLHSPHGACEEGSTKLPTVPALEKQAARADGTWNGME